MERYAVFRTQCIFRDRSVWMCAQQMETAGAPLRAQPLRRRSHIARLCPSRSRESNPPANSIRTPRLGREPRGARGSRPHLRVRWMGRGQEQRLAQDQDDRPGPPDGDAALGQREMRTETTRTAAEFSSPMWAPARNPNGNVLLTRRMCPVQPPASP